ncbi:MAG: indolepyruvate oxidoreductase subunit beta [Deltaproteobacteria bacterium]|nr:indolepyruvate oxidoreductase subunit beta [Deltaproteobacteria bacterium]
MNLADKDPINLIIAGVGGQGNILISRLIGQCLVEKGYLVTIGETYGASQRGGSVASHVRISRESPFSPITPGGDADIILGLEPVESLRLLCLYGSPTSVVISNTRPIHPVAVAVGEAQYPTLQTIKALIGELSRKAWYIDASEIALTLGAPVLTNIVMTGTLFATGLLPLAKEDFEQQMRASFSGSKLAANLEAFSRGGDAIREN